jgi:hypothetical protein
MNCQALENVDRKKSCFIAFLPLERFFWIVVEDDIEMARKRIIVVLSHYYDFSSTGIPNFIINEIPLTVAHTRHWSFKDLKGLGDV